VTDESQADPDAAGWEAYYRRHEGRAPQQLLVDVLDRFEAERTAPELLQAIDLGCGPGNETLAMLKAGWWVLAIDSHPSAISRVRSVAGAEHQPRLATRLASFEQIELPETDLIWAGYSLPFCKPGSFDRLWAEIASNLRPGGRFAGQLFGVRDSWASQPEMNFHTAEQVNQLFARGFVVEFVEEREEDGGSGAGPKHWHVFDIVARRPDS